MSLPLPHYLRYHRRRSGLTQAEVALLLGVAQGDGISRYERSLRIPTLEAALALAIVFDVSVDDLFRGMRERAKRRIGARIDAVRARPLGGRTRAQTFLTDLELRLSP